MTKEEAVARIKDHIEVHHIQKDIAVKTVQALNMAIEALERTEWRYPSKGEYPDENGEYLFLVEAFSNIYRVVGNYEVLKNQRLWSAQVADEWVEDEPIAWMPLPDPPKEEA